MSRQRDSSPGSLVGFPRVSGDEPGNLSMFFHLMVFSPRERG